MACAGKAVLSPVPSAPFYSGTSLKCCPAPLRLSVLPVLSSHPHQRLCSVPPGRSSRRKGTGKVAGGRLRRAEPKWWLGCHDENQRARAGCQQTSHTALNASALTCDAPVIADVHLLGGPQSRAAALHSSHCGSTLSCLIASFIVTAGQDFLWCWLLCTEGSLWWCMLLQSGPPIPCKVNPLAPDSEQNNIKLTDDNFSCLRIIGW